MLMWARLLWRSIAAALCVHLRHKHSRTALVKVRTLARFARLNTVFEHAVLTLHLEAQCLAKIANTALFQTPCLPYLFN